MIINRNEVIRKLGNVMVDWHTAAAAAGHLLEIYLQIMLKFFIMLNNAMTYICT